MKKIIGVIVVLVAGLLAYNYVTTGKFSLVPSLTLSEDERALKALEDRFHAATRQYTQAARAAGMSGLDTTADGEAALRTVERIEKDLRVLRKRLSSQPAIQRAEHLATAIKEFSAKLG